jgi:hypothetical protein
VISAQMRKKIQRKKIKEKTKYQKEKKMIINDIIPGKSLHIRVRAHGLLNLDGRTNKLATRNKAAYVDRWRTL